MPVPHAVDELAAAASRPLSDSPGHHPWAPSAAGGPGWRDPLVRRGALGTTLVSAGSLTPAFLPPQPAIVDLLDLQWLSSGAGRLAATALLVLGMALLVDAWLRLRPAPGSPPISSRTWLLWSLPLLVAPPLFSRDAYSYAAQGLLVGLGMDPYVVGPSATPGPFADQVDPLWLYTPAPYGPLGLQIQHLVVTLTGEHAYLAAVAMRLPALLAVGLLAATLPRLAERFGVSRDHALWLGVLNPLVLMHFIGGAHNDAIMIALVVSALLLASHRHLLLASMTVAAAASVKQTGALALVGVLGLALSDGQARRERPRSSDAAYFARCAAWVGAAAAATFTVITMLTGLGWGWVANLSVPVSLRSMLAPPTLVGSLIEWLMTVGGMPDPWVELALPVVRGAAALIGLAVIAWLAWRVAPRAPVVATASAFLVFCATGPVVHPWYVLWGGVLLGATALGSRAIQAVVWVTLFLVTYGVVDTTVSNGSWALGITTIVWMGVRLHQQRHPARQLPFPSGAGWSGSAATTSSRRVS